MIAYTGNLAGAASSTPSRGCVTRRSPLLDVCELVGVQEDQAEGFERLLLEVARLLLCGAGVRLDLLLLGRQEGPRVGHLVRTGGPAEGQGIGAAYLDVDVQPGLAHQARGEVAGLIADEGAVQEGQHLGRDRRD